MTVSISQQFSLINGVVATKDCNGLPNGYEGINAITRHEPGEMEHLVSVGTTTIRYSTAGEAAWAARSDGQAKIREFISTLTE